jgi:hypothetical protein
VGNGPSPSAWHLHGPVFAGLAFSSQIADICGRGGLYAVVPVATVFLFSYVHGSFAGNFWSALGIEASKKQRVTVQPSQPRQDRRPRATLQA